MVTEVSRLTRTALVVFRTPWMTAQVSRTVCLNTCSGKLQQLQICLDSVGGGVGIQHRVGGGTYVLDSFASCRFVCVSVTDRGSHVQGILDTSVTTSLVL